MALFAESFSTPAGRCATLIGRFAEFEAIGPLRGCVSVTNFEDLLAVGDLRSDGLANEVVTIVSAQPELLPDLVDALASEKPAVRGHAADALEKLARIRPAPFLNFLSIISRQAVSDEVPMVRWHLAMLLTHVSTLPRAVSIATPTLLRLLHDRSPFVRSWAITGVALNAQRRPTSAPAAVRAISPLTRDPSPAVAKRAQTAVRALTDPGFKIPASWVKT